MKLVIDTTNNRKSTVRVGETELVREYKDPRGQDILKLVDEALTQAGLERGGITEIEVNPGPGDFTSTRVGVAVANALGFALKIPVNGGTPGEFVKPVYEKPPISRKPKQ